MTSRTSSRAIFAFALAMGCAPEAYARCDINAAGISITPVTSSTGTYSPPTVPTAQSVTFTVSGTYNTNATAGTCRVAISFNRASLPATMARSGGGATMPYTIRTTATGGNTLLFTGGGVPPAANRLLVSFVSAGANLVNRAFSVPMTAFFLAQPVDPQRAGSYSDGLTVRFYNVRASGTATDLGGRAFTVNGTVASVCTIGGVTNPAIDTANIPVSPTGTVTTTPISRTYLNAVCNSPTNVLASSVNGAVRTSGTAPSGFTTMINYTAAATFSGATSNLNTATNAAASGQEDGSVATTAGTTPSGSLAVTITPQPPALRLIQGGYADTLRITLTPQ